MRTNFIIIAAVWSVDWRHQAYTLNLITYSSLSFNLRQAPDFRRGLVLEYTETLFFQGGKIDHEHGNVGGIDARDAPRLSEIQRADSV